MIATEEIPESKTFKPGDIISNFTRSDFRAILGYKGFDCYEYVVLLDTRNPHRKGTKASQPRFVVDRCFCIVNISELYFRDKPSQL